MAFALRLQRPKLSEDVIYEKVTSAAEILGITEYLQRKPKALSGGQCQRVALGRAIVRQAKVFLMDEPLSNLDAKLRVQMRSELIRLHNSLATTTIYVTHDQIEAMTMASRIVVMKDGWIQQVGAPKEIYDNPRNVFVAGFIGTPSMNFVHGNLDENGVFTTPDGHRLTVPAKKVEMVKAAGLINKDVIFGIRPEDIYDDEDHLLASDNNVNITVDVAELLGATTNIHFEMNGSHVCAAVSARADVRIGDKLKLAIDVNKCHFFDPKTELCVTVPFYEKPAE
jgi:multiple sugar transport system ATP-binding protein